MEQDYDEEPPPAEEEQQQQYSSEFGYETSTKEEVSPRPQEHENSTIEFENAEGKVEEEEVKKNGVGQTKILALSPEDNTGDRKTALPHGLEDRGGGKKSSGENSEDVEIQQGQDDRNNIDVESAGITASELERHDGTQSKQAIPSSPSEFKNTGSQQTIHLELQVSEEGKRSSGLAQRDEGGYSVESGYKSESFEDGGGSSVRYLIQATPKTRNLWGLPLWQFVTWRRWTFGDASG